MNNLNIKCRTLRTLTAIILIACILSLVYKITKNQVDTQYFLEAFIIPLCLGMFKTCNDGIKESLT